MGIMKKLANIFSQNKQAEQRAYWLYVQCAHCGEKIKARVDLYNDLSPIYAEEGITYFCRKVLIGQKRCYQKIEVELSFDEKRLLTSREIKGGSLINAEEFEADQ